MANILEFVIDIQSRQRGVTAQVQRVQEKLDDADRSAKKLNTSLSGLKTALMSLPGAQFLTNPIVAMTAATGVIAKMGMDAGKTATSFNVLTGSMEKGSKLLGEINKYADDTIYDRLGTQEAAKTMLGFGVSLETVMGDLKMLGDVAMGDQQRMSQLALVFGQVAAAGKLQGGDLIQLINAGYNPLLDMSALTGKSVSELRDEMSKGNITFEMMRQAFQRATSEGGKFYNMTNEIAKTPFGRWQQLLGEFNQKLLEMYQIIEPALIPAMNGLSSLLSKTTPVIKGIADAVGWVRDNLSWLGPILTGVGASWAVYNGYMFVSTTILKGWTIAQWAQVTAMMAAAKAQRLLNLAFKASPIGWVVLAVGALVTAFTLAWNYSDKFRAGIKAAWDVVKGFGGILKDYVIDRINGLLDGLGAMASAIRKLFSGDFEGAARDARTGARGIFGVDAKAAFMQSTAKLGSNIPGYYQSRLAAERNKQLSEPKSAGGTSSGGSVGNTPPTDENGKGSDTVVTGGTRNTQITMNITKFFDNINVSMHDKADTREIQRIVLESINRSLEIATSAAR